MDERDGRKVDVWKGGRVDGQEERRKEGREDGRKDVGREDGWVAEYRPLVT